MTDDQDDDLGFDPSRKYQHRVLAPIRDTVVRKDVQTHIDALLELESASHPINGPVPDKEMLSIDALMHAGELVNLLAGWAIDHQIGLVLNGVEGFPWPKGDDEARLKAANHEHEESGSAREGLTPELIREIAIAVMSRAPLLPEGFNHILAEGLQSLEFGETPKFLSPKSQQRKRNYTLWHFRHQAILHISYFRGRGYRKGKATELVAGAFGCSPETVISWEKSLPKRFGAQKVKFEKALVRAFGEGVERRQNTIPKGPHDEEYIASKELEYGSEKLALNSRDYKAVLKESTATRPVRL